MRTGKLSRLGGGTGSLRVGRDSLGVPVILADNAEDAWYAWGWVHARDRWFQMDIARRAAAGRLAEWFGATALSHDRMLRSFDLTATAAAVIERCADDERRLLQAYSDGVNAARVGLRRRSLTHRLTGTHPAPWTAADCALVLLQLYISMAFDLDGRRTELVLHHCLDAELADFLMPQVDAYLSPQALPKLPSIAIARQFAANAGLPHASAVLATTAGIPGSNCWTIAGQQVAGGRALLACDTHLPPVVPNTWHRVQMEIGRQRICGAAAAGLPIVVMGSNGVLSWGVTNLPGDTLDLIPAERIGGTRTWRDEIITVRGEPDQLYRVEVTLEGPVLPIKVLRAKVVARWSGAWPASSDFGFGRIALCHSLNDAIDAARRAGGPPMNVHLAHAMDGTARTLSGRIPLRVDGVLARDRYRCPADVPVLREVDGLLVTANGTSQQAGDPSALGWNHPSGYRTYRIRELLQQHRHWTEREVAALQHDVRAGFLDPYRDLLLATLPTDASPLDERMRLAAYALDGHCSAQALGAALLVSFRDHLVSALLTPLLAGCAEHDPGFRYAWRNPEAMIRAWLSARGPLPAGQLCAEGWQGFVHGQASAAAQHLERLFGCPVDALRWERFVYRDTRHFLSGTPLACMFALPRLPANGTDECVSVLSVGAVPAQRLVVIPGREAEALFAMPGGQSENPFSKHYRDHHRLWCRDRYVGLVAHPRGMTVLRRHHQSPS